MTWSIFRAGPTDKSLADEADWRFRRDRFWLSRPLAYGLGRSDHFLLVAVARGKVVGYLVAELLGPQMLVYEIDASKASIKHGLPTALLDEITEHAISASVGYVLVNCGKGKGFVPYADDGQVLFDPVTRPFTCRLQSEIPLPTAAELRRLERYLGHPLGW